MITKRFTGYKTFTEHDPTSTTTHTHYMYTKDIVSSS